MRKWDERTADDTATLRTAMDATSNNIRVAIPGIVTAWNEEQQTVDVQPTLREQVNINGEVGEMSIPLLVDVPVVLPSVGGYSFLCAPREGDECLVIFADMCIDSWWQSGDIQSQMDKRRHDLSDGFAVLGCWSQPNVKPRFPAPEEGCVVGRDESGPRMMMTETMLRIEDEEDGASVTLENGVVTVVGGEVLVNGGEVTINGGTVNINGVLVINGVPYVEHKHNGVESGGGISGGVVT